MDVSEKSDAVFIAWVQKAKLAARETTTSSISIKGLISTILEIKKMTNQRPEDDYTRLVSSRSINEMKKESERLHRREKIYGKKQ